MANLLTLQRKVDAGEKLALLTCYDASFAAQLEAVGVDALLVGDTLGMVVQGQRSTLPVSVADMVYHTAAVARGAPNTLIIADLPFGSYQAGPAQAFQSAARLMGAGAHCVKLEGGAIMGDTVGFLTARGIPVCGHLGLLPQSVNSVGGYTVQAKTTAAAQQLLDDAKVLSRAGASMIVLEAIPAPVAKKVTAAIDIPTIGIGAGVDCDGQVLVLYDMLGISPGKPPRFARNFMQGAPDIATALADYVAAVRQATFPTEQHSYFSMHS